MITPRFSITQDEDNLIFKIDALHGNLNDLTVDYYEKTFYFSCKPYYLRVHLSHNVQNIEDPNTSYDVNTGVFTITVPKQEKGQVFENLQMTNELLNPQRLPTAQNMVEEIDEEDGSEYLQEQHLRDIKAGIKDEEANSYGYGFGWRRTGVLEQLRSEIGNLIDLREPELVPLNQRVIACEEYDYREFKENYEHYLGDYLKPEEEFLNVINNTNTLPYARLQLTAADLDRLKDLPNKKLPPISDEVYKSSLYTIVDLVFAWAYDQRVNGWESNCESGWTITKLSPSLSFLVKWENLQDVCNSVVRRSLCYPLYRNWDLAMQVLDDVKKIFQNGKTTLLHILCEIHEIMIAASEFRYLLNDLLITDLVLWIQTVPQNKIYDLTKELSAITISKDDLNLDLNEIELNAKILLMAIGNKDSDDESDNEENVLEAR